MVDIDQEPQEDFAEEAAGDFTTGIARETAPDPAAAAAAASPLVRLLGALKGKKKPAAAAAGLPVPDPGAAPKPAPRKPAVPGQRAPVPMPPGPLLSIVTRNEFYRDGFRRLVMIAIMEAVAIGLLLVALIFFIGTGKSQDRYFATTADGRIMQLLPLDQPNMPTSGLMSWVSQATSEIMTFGYSDYQRRLQQSSRHFTHRGWSTFTDALQKSHIVDGMQAGKEVLTASPRAAPTLTQEGVLNGKYRWIVRLPLQVKYESLNARRTDNLIVTLVIERVPSLENPNGVAIDQWISIQG